MNSGTTGWKKWPYFPSCPVNPLREFVLLSSAAPGTVVPDVLDYIVEMVLPKDIARIPFKILYIHTMEWYLEIKRSTTTF